MPDGSSPACPASRRRRAVLSAAALTLGLALGVVAPAAAAPTAHVTNFNAGTVTPIDLADVGADPGEVYGAWAAMLRATAAG